MPAFILNDNKIKSIDLPQYPDAAWDFTGNPPPSADSELKARVAAANQAVNKVANVFASVPFSILSGDNEIDKSGDYTNALGWLPYPKSLLRQWAKSLIMTNRAYAFREGRGRSITKLRYIAPQTITEIKTDDNGIVSFRRTINGKSQVYLATDNRIFHAFALDYDEELLPGENTLFKSIASSAKILLYADYWIGAFFERGGIRPHMLMVKGAPNKDARERIESTWAKLMRGIRGTIGKIWDADSLEAKPLGDGIDSLRASPVYENALRNIAIGLGMPQDYLIQDSANYATAQIHQSSFWTDTITPMCELFQEALNVQIFEPFGYRWQFNVEMAEPNQQEETERAGAYASYVSSGMKPSIAAQIVGIDLPPGVEFDDLDPEEPEEPEPQPAPAAPVMEDEPADTEEPDEPEDEPAVRFVPNFDQLKELKDWRDVASRKFKRGEWPMMAWNVKTLPAEVAASITAKLDIAADAEAVKAAFDLDDTELKTADTAALLELAAALNSYTEALTKPEPEMKAAPMPNITVNLTAQMPAVDTPTVTVNVPEQPAPVVNVTNEVNPADVKITNDVTVQPAPVTVTPAPATPRKLTATVKRNADGQITGIEAK